MVEPGPLLRVARATRYSCIGLGQGWRTQAGLHYALVVSVAGVNESKIPHREESMKLSRLNRPSILILAFYCSGGVGVTWGGEPLNVVKTAAEAAVAVMRDPKLKAPDQKQERIERLKVIINPIFDYKEMARRSLGPHWRRQTPAEQEEFARLFRGFLEKIYSDRVHLYDGEKVTFGRETIDQDYAQVESTVINAKGEENSVVYRLKRTEGTWKVYDAVVENISIVNNYRSQFDRVISKSSYDELKKMLREKAG
jgi:phospholipid transport system substrate-binding protein